MTIACTIMSGAGNVFTVIDNRHYNFSIDEGKHIAPLLCSAKYAGKTTEGMMLIAPSPRADEHFRMEFFNPDGSHGAMCGNGGRCAVRFAVEQGITQQHDPLVFSVLDAVYTASFHGETISVSFPPPREVNFTYPIVIGNTTVDAGYVNVGSDHLVLNIDDIAPLLGAGFSSFDIRYWGALVRNHPRVAPRGANANFYSLQPDGLVYLRTFERGVEAETGACGTGAIATTLIAAHRHKLAMPVCLVPTSGRALQVTAHNSGAHGIVLEGDAVVEYAIDVEIEAKGTGVTG